MTTSIEARLAALEPKARPLEPGVAERAEVARAALAHAESFLKWVDSSPGLVQDTGSDAALSAAPIGREPIGLERALALLADHVDFAGQNTTAPGFFAYIPLGNVYHSAIADFLAAISNRFSGRLDAAPGSVRIENQVTGWLASVVGYPSACGGNLASGGSMANLIAIVTAREAAGIRSRDAERAVVYLTEQVHHCVPKGLRVAGMGECVVRRIPMDDRFRMDPEALDRTMADDARAGLRPWLVVGTAGTTDTGAVDPLEAMAEIAARRGAWFHVDGAYGAVFALCAEGRELLRGMDRSDSLVLDPHKGLFIPLGLGAVLVRDASAMRAAYSFEANYIPEDALTREEPSPMQYSPELSRPFRALRLWLPLQVMGTAPFEAAVEEKLLLARYAYARLRNVEGIEVGPEPELSIVVFRPRAGRDEDATALCTRLERALQEDGRISLSSTMLGGARWLRF
ncbi:MAG TPA: aminotransferase class V-fold PLP-dependent enzyme, partial [Candidatus Eisenbacteria bacterium]|nr:aminotransferase class V-fold PLP-dependent enzyme [Candidatus Eisenbacteria bacterium]